MDIEGYFIDQWLFGFWGAILRFERENSQRAGFVEYRLVVESVARGLAGAVIPVQGGWVSQMIDRESTMRQTNIVAAQATAWKLNTELAPLLNIVPNIYEVRGNTPNLNLYVSALQ
jgi:hypothetical protein